MAGAAGCRDGCSRGEGPTGAPIKAILPVAAHTALRVLRGQARPGAGTPIQMIGPELVTETGGELLIP